ncbi:MAG: site-2 protease family protein [bacterium]|nr:site-2 protease family protein [bacterium]
MELAYWRNLLKAGWDLPRALVVLNRALIFAMALMGGILAASALESVLDQVPSAPQQVGPPPGPTRIETKPFDQFAATLDQNIFGVERGSAPNKETADPEPSAPQGNLAQWVARLELAGVYGAKVPRCIVTDKQTSNQGLFRVGEALFESGPVFKEIGGTLKEPKVLLAMGGQEAWLGLAQNPTAAAPTPLRQLPPSAAKEAPPVATESADNYSKNGKDYFITSAEVDSQLNNLPALLNQARVIPHFKEGKHDGYVIKAIDKGSLYEKLGLKNHDVIQRINGETIDSPEEAFSLLKMLRNERQITLNIDRKGSEKTLVYHIN